MTRKKVTLAYITNDSERKASFKKRKKGLIKKVSELSTLCGVEACAIIYSPYDPRPEVWPSQEGAMAVLARFRRLSEMDQCRKMVNQESFTRQRVKKAEDQCIRVRKDNKRREMENFLYQWLAGMVSLDDFDARDRGEMTWILNQILRDLTSRMAGIRNPGGNLLLQGSGSGSGSGSEALEAEDADEVGAIVPVNPMVVEMAPLPPPSTPLAAPAPPMDALPALPQAAEVVEQLPALMGADYLMESFPWNLIESPSRAAIGTGLFYSWDDGMVLPPYNPYNFNQDANNFAPFGLEPGTGPDALN
ncbi:hypothetical protein ABFS82_02G133900 [Erythranthe guttata]|nr:PREDICTED: agamous-like MADS-box protein AGL80 [Erythranthe guttata]|eukprot:XP_012833873.1 PREDICTED: agamous-like MADS-box protein AGL80 [Erythranthe guttata]